MDTLELKKILATLSIAGLLTAGIPVTVGCASAEGSCTGDKKGAKTEETAEEESAEETPAPSS
jgi:radical SAM modification target selenobiotic family peptide